MSLTKDEKNSVIKAFKTSNEDTGSPQVQIALLTAKIAKLSDHLKGHRKDNHSRRGLLRSVGMRRKLYKFLETVEGMKVVNDLKKQLEEYVAKNFVPATS